MIQNLTSAQLFSLITTVFAPKEGEGDLTFMLDLPDERTADNALWMDRRRIAAEWYIELRRALPRLPFRTLNFAAYPNVGTNNGDLPPAITVVDATAKHEGSTAGNHDIDLRTLLGKSAVVLSLTEYSATAPLKVLARELGFRGATLPGFSRAMVPALFLNYEDVNRRVGEIKQRMDDAEAATVQLTADGQRFLLRLDLRFRKAHASGGILHEPGTVGNLPSGEAYIVPFEGESPTGGNSASEAAPQGESRTEGILPVQFGDEMVFFRIEKNRAVGVEGHGAKAEEQRRLLNEEPAYGNIAELGVGVLGEWGIGAVGSLLLDEKLGLHIAFGRSEHFGGITGPSAFRDPRRVVHIDWVYVPTAQPRVVVNEVRFTYPGGRSELIMENGVLSV